MAWKEPARRRVMGWAYRMGIPRPACRCPRRKTVVDGSERKLKDGGTENVERMDMNRLEETEVGRKERILAKTQTTLRAEVEGIEKAKGMA